MKTLSIRAPWWWWILYGGKDVENRNRPTQHRGPILLQASLWYEKQEYDEDNETALKIGWSVHDKGGYAPPIPNDDSRAWTLKNSGHIVGMADIVGCIQKDAGGAGGWHMADQYGWMLANVVPLRNPYPAKGALGLFNAPASGEVCEILMKRRDAGLIAEDAINDILGV